MLKLEYKDNTLEFKFDAGTSRGILRQHRIVVLKVCDPRNPGVVGLGEAAPLIKLSVERVEDVLDEMENLSEKLRGCSVPQSEGAVYELVRQIVPEELPSLRFGLETALLDLKNDGRRIIFDGDFVRGLSAIPINALIWMGDPDFMKAQIDKKMARGHKCIKMKVGALDFQEELRLLRYLRAQSENLIIRLDANGGFKTNEVLANLKELKGLNIHSIEQPIASDQWHAMELVCKLSPIPIALDEELIGSMNISQKEKLLKFIKPQFIVLKPTLLGGFYQTMEWIELAGRLQIGWWITSALESNIGLNAIAQLAGQFSHNGYHGLGTGQLYHNNFTSPLELEGEHLRYKPEKNWAVELL